MIQEGIFWQEKSTPGTNLGMVFVRFSEDAEISEIYRLIQSIDDLVQQLKNGVDPYIPGTKIPNGDLTFTLGYGRNLFNKYQTKKSMPQALEHHGKLRQPLASGGGLVLRGSRLEYQNSITKNQATEDFVLQFTAKTNLAVNRAIIYVINLISDMEQVIASISKFYTGFHRDDKRSWIGFHDGISNLKSGNERLGVISIKPGIVEDNWVKDGTYMFFMRIKVNVPKWNKLSIAKQEELVGRMKATGCPIRNYDSGIPVPETGCPIMGTSSIVDIDSNGDYPNQHFFEPPISTDLKVKVSHVQRANQHIQPPSDRNSLRIFRQGYEFLDSIDKQPGYQAGLNFISFQDTPERVIRMLTQPSWLGNINFGGKEEEQDVLGDFLEVISGGIYLIPPVNRVDKIPGYELFEEDNV